MKHRGPKSDDSCTFVIQNQTFRFSFRCSRCFSLGFWHIRSSSPWYLPCGGFSPRGRLQGLSLAMLRNAGHTRVACLKFKRKLSCCLQSVPGSLLEGSEGASGGSKSIWRWGLGWTFENAWATSGSRNGTGKSTRGSTLGRKRYIFVLKHVKIVFVLCHRLQQLFIANEFANMSKS